MSMMHSLDMNTASILSNEHPSYGCEQAWFLFSVQSDGRISKLLLIEAKNIWAVQTLERLAVDGLVSQNCQLLAVHRRCSDVGIRSDLVDEIDYVDFILDVVDPRRITGDQWAAASFQQSLTPSDRAKALNKMQAPVAPRAAVVDNVVPIRPQVFDPENSENYQDVLAALTDLGYKRPQAKRAVDALGSRVDEMSLANAVKAALQGCLNT